MIVKIIGTTETVEVPDEPHSVEVEHWAFDTLVRKRLRQGSPGSQPPTNAVSEG